MSSISSSVLTYVRMENILLDTVIVCVFQAAEITMSQSGHIKRTLLKSMNGFVFLKSQEKPTSWSVSLITTVRTFDYLNLKIRTVFLFVFLFKEHMKREPVLVPQTVPASVSTGPSHVLPPHRPACFEPFRSAGVALAVAPAAQGRHSALPLLQALDLVINIDRSVRKGALITEPSSA